MMKINYSLYNKIKLMALISEHINVKLILTDIQKDYLNDLDYKGELKKNPLLNEQILEDKYSHYIKDYNYETFHYSHEDFVNKQKYIKNISKYEDNFIMTSCYQSCKNLMRNCKRYNLTFDVIIYDEAHFITSWLDKIESSSYSSDTDTYKNLDEYYKYKAFHFLIDDTICKHKIFGSATPTEEIENNSIYFGHIIEKVKVHELINNQILCDIETIIKDTGDKKKEYHNLKNLIIENMIKYNKKKGIVYVNDTINAENLYKLMKTQDKINSYIYVSKEVIVEDELDSNITAFEKNKNKSIIIVVGKLGYGYDNDYIDFICLGDPRQSDIDIRQILGRGLRWNKKTYPNKLLHLLVPLYKDEFGEYKKNEHLKKYLDYIIGECDKDFIIRNGFPIKKF
jgi:superfamily II DNA or RNA helicase